MPPSTTRLENFLQIHRHIAVRIISLIVAANGLFIIATTLEDQLEIHRITRLNDLTISIPLLIGISLVYLSTLLRRRKYTAWFVSILAYTFYLGLNLNSLSILFEAHRFHALLIGRLIVLPLLIIALLYGFRSEFVVRSDIQGFRSASRFIVIILLMAFLYGVGGFLILDKSDFHQKITTTSAVHYTLDRFDLTTNQPLKAYTKRAHLFVDSLSVVSIAAFGYAALALFQPLRGRLSGQAKNSEQLHALMLQYGAPSEDYFKLWPADKQYFFDESGESGLAFHVRRGVAICLGDPVGNPETFPRLMANYTELCFSNDWSPVYVHIEDSNRTIYEKQGFTMQRLGQEAVVRIADFQETVARNKYFRHISNKFVKQGYTAELLSPPHHQAVIDRLAVISKEWLSRGGREERGFAMGYFAPTYLQDCPLFVVRDAAGTIRAFLNQLPADFDTKEATYDLLRHTDDSPGNINDFLMLSFIAHAGNSGYERVNLGLCPLTGLDEEDKDSNGLIDGLLRFAYANGDRFYSFSGLYRFKAKYEPEWRDRYVAYKGGLRGFSKAMTALMLSMRVKTK